MIVKSRPKKQAAGQKGRRHGVPVKQGVDNVVALYEQGMPIKEIAAVWGTSVNNVWKCLDRRGVYKASAGVGPFRGDKGRFEERRAAIHHMIGQRATYLQMGPALGIRPSGLLSWIRRWMPYALPHVLVVPDKRGGETRAVLDRARAARTGKAWRTSAWNERLAQAREAWSKKRRLTVAGESRSIREWAALVGVPEGTIRGRLVRSATPAQAISRERLPHRRKR